MIKYYCFVLFSVVAEEDYNIRALLLIGVNPRCRKRLCYANNMLLLYIIIIYLRYVRSTANRILSIQTIIILRCVHRRVHTLFYCFYYFIRFRGLDTQCLGIIYYYYYVQTIGIGAQSIKWRRKRKSLEITRNYSLLYNILLQYDDVTSTAARLYLINKRFRYDSDVFIIMKQFTRRVYCIRFTMGIGGPKIHKVCAIVIIIIVNTITRNLKSLLLIK